MPNPNPKHEAAKSIERMTNAVSGNLTDGSNVEFNANDLVSWMVITMLADGEIDSSEKRLILKYSEQHDVSQIYIKNLINATAAGSLAPPVPQSQAEAEIWITEVLGMAMADGEVTKCELLAVKNLAASVGMDHEYLKQLVAKIRESTSSQTQLSGNLGDLAKMSQSSNTRLEVPLEKTDIAVASDVADLSDLSKHVQGRKTPKKGVRRKRRR